MNEIQFNHIIKRDGSIVPFTSIRITNAIYRAAIAAGERDRAMAEALTKRVLQLMKSEIKSDTPSVEEAQDIIEKVLIEAGQVKISKAFILYRDERARKR
ncbi:TPA: response regulator SirA, partial [bacterium]|nr:response regulator SirA [bacterium]